MLKGWAPWGDLNGLKRAMARTKAAWAAESLSRWLVRDAGGSRPVDLKRQDLPDAPEAGKTQSVS